MGGVVANVNVGQGFACFTSGTGGFGLFRYRDWNSGGFGASRIRNGQLWTLLTVSPTLTRPSCTTRP